MTDHRVSHLSAAGYRPAEAWARAFMGVCPDAIHLDYWEQRAMPKAVRMFEILLEHAADLGVHTDLPADPYYQPMTDRGLVGS